MYEKRTNTYSVRCEVQTVLLHGRTDEIRREATNEHGVHVCCQEITRVYLFCDCFAASERVFISQDPTNSLKKKSLIVKVVIKCVGPLDTV